MQLKIYTDKKFVRKGAKYNYIPLMYPFWGECDSTQGHIDIGRFDDYTKNGHKFFSLVSIEESDVVVLPSEWPEGGDYPEAQMLLQLATTWKKSVIVFFNSDSVEKIPVENAIIFRTSFYTYEKKENEFALPGWNIDFLNYSLGTIIRDKTITPTVSYCGYLDYHNIFSKSFIYHLIRIIRYGKESNPGKALRGKAVRYLSKSNLLKTKFIIRQRTLNYTNASAEKIRMEYYENILNTDYALVVRGKGNFSYRLYEVLSCGRIPVFVNTNCVLPFDHIIDWKKYVVWIEHSEINHIADKVVKFHKSLSEEEFKQLQFSIRKLYDEWIKPTGFYKNLWRCLPEKFQDEHSYN